MSTIKLKTLLEGFAWERKADGSLPTLADTTAAYARKLRENHSDIFDEIASELGLTPEQFDSAVNSSRAELDVIENLYMSDSKTTNEALALIADMLDVPYANDPAGIDFDDENFSDPFLDDPDFMEAAKPDYIDLDNDGNETETMKKAAHDKQMQNEGERAYKNSSNNELASHIGQLKTELDAEKDPAKRKLIQQDLEDCKKELDSRKQNEGLTERDLMLIESFRKNLNSARRY